MAQANLLVVAEGMLRLLGSEEFKEIGAVLGVPAELLMGLKQTISVLTPKLRAAEKIITKSSINDEREGLRNWLIKVEDAVYDADNSLEDLSAEALRLRRRRRSMTSGNLMANLHQVCSPFFSSSSSSLKVPKDVIEGIKERLDRIAVEGRVLNLEERSTDEDGVFVTKREEDKKKIIENLLIRTSKETVYAIVGVDGIEKTTLARDVFDDERVKRHFDLKTWLELSHSFDTEQIIREILECGFGKTIEDRSMESLQRLLRFLFRFKACLIVLDVVDWSNEDLGKWESLMHILGKVAAAVSINGSKILVTTSCMEVAVSIRCTMLSYPLQVLDKEQSWISFQKVVGEELPKTFRTEIVTNNCIGLPIAIAAIGISVLRLKYSDQGLLLNEKRVDERLSWVFRMHNFMIFRTLKLSYNELLSPIKCCFAYCSLFPKDYEIDVQTLIKLWMAQGFIEPSTTGKSPEAIGYDYFLKLLQGYFFEQVGKDVRGRVAKCRMHEWMREFAVHVAENQCSRLSSPSTHDRIGPNFHVSFHFDLFSAKDIPNPSIHEEKVRSILLPCQSRQKQRGVPDNTISSIVISRFRCLRALDMHDLGIKIVPDSIGTLKLLKYLDLSENEDITELPNSITNLVNLQTLRLSSCFGLKKLPSGFNNLIKLRHLEIEGCYNLNVVLRDIGQVRDLQISELVVTQETSVRDGKPYEVGATAIIDKFHIKNLGHAKDEMAKYENFTRQARSLSLEWKTHTPKSADKKSDEDKATIHSKLFPAVEELSLYGFGGERLLFDSFPSYVVKLSLWRCENCKFLPPLHQLFKLKVLVLDQIPNLEYISENPSSSRTTLIFPSLQELWLTELPNLQGWWKSGVKKLPSVNVDCPKPFYCLSKLVIEDCPKLDSMPLFPTLDEELVLDKTCCWEPFRLTMSMKTTADHNEASSSSSSTSPALSELKKLSIVDIQDCEADKILWVMLKSLRYLRFDGLPTLVTLPEGLQQVTSLVELQVWRSGLKEIPKWIGQLKNLQKLVIRLCPNLDVLPQEINQLLKSKTLEMGDILAVLS